jgi:hypothetical protein
VSVVMERLLGKSMAMHRRFGRYGFSKIYRTLKFGHFTTQLRKYAGAVLEVEWSFQIVAKQ